MNVLLISYWPLFNYSKHLAGQSLTGQTMELTEKWLKTLEFENFHVHACLWTADGPNNQIFAPVLVLSNAQRFVDHITGWTENHPTEWFKLIIIDNGTNYVVSLFPIIEKSIERWKLSYAIMHGGQTPPNDYEYNVIFHPVAVGAPISQAYSLIKKNGFPTEMKIGVIDMGHLNPDRPQDTDLNKVLPLGTFELTTPTYQQGWIDEYLLDLKPPLRKGFYQGP